MLSIDRPTTSSPLKRTRFNNLLTTSKLYKTSRTPDNYYYPSKHNPNDKETLKAESYQLKQKLNSTSQENYLLKTRCLKLEDQVETLLKRQNKPKNKLDAYYSTESISNQQTNLVIDLKKKIRELTQVIQNKDEIIEQLKINQKTLRFNEIQIELTKFQQESFRLKNMLDQLFKINQDDEDKVKQDNVEMAAIIKDQEKKIQCFKTQIQELETKNYRAQKEKTILKQKITVLEKEVSELKIVDHYAIFKNLNQNQALEGIKSELEKKIMENENMNQTLIYQERKIQELVKMNEDLKQQYEEIQKNFVKEKEQLGRRVAILKEELNDLQCSTPVNKSRLSIENPKQSQFSRERLISPFKRQETTFDLEDNSGVIVNSVKKEDIKQIANQLKFKLRSIGIEIKDLDNYINLRKDQQLTIVNLTKVFQKYPFELNKKDSLKVARYFIEDSEESQINLDLSQSSTSARVRSILRNFLSNYEIFNNEEEIERQIIQTLSKFKSSIKDYLMNETQNKKICSQTQFLNALSYCDIQLQNKLLEYIWQTNYEITRSINSVSYDKILERFTQ